MNKIFQCFIGLLLVAATITSCDQQPAEVSAKQLTTKKYYAKEMRGDVEVNHYRWYKPYIYFYNGKPYTGRFRDVDEKGNLKSTGKMKDGFHDGYWIYYNQNGSFKSQGSYKNGVQDSIWTMHYTDGNPKAEIMFHLENDSLKRDTINAWYYNGQKMWATNGDTVRRYYQNGRLMSKSITGATPLQEAYMKDGTLLFKADANKKEVYFADGKVRSKTFYVKSKKGRETLDAEKYKWSKEEQDAIEKADSVLLDFSNYWDPVIKIYVKED